MSKNMSSSKSLCSVCGFVVKTDGHEGRCRVVDVQQVSKLRRLAWLGDVRHTADIRIMLLSMSLPGTELQLHAARYLSKHHQASFYRDYDGDKVPAAGESEHSISTAFEASYCGGFRRDYLVWLSGLIKDVYEVSGEFDSSLVVMRDQLVQH